MPTPPLKLEIELVPETCFGTNLRARMSQKQWDKHRKEVIAKVGGVCEVCGSDRKLHCHEKWQYDDKAHVQKLIGFGVLCAMCHYVCHFGLAEGIAARGKLDLDAVIEHFCAVNDVSRKFFEGHRDMAYSTHISRSRREWTTDLGEWSHLATKPAKSDFRRRL